MSEDDGTNHLFGNLGFEPDAKQLTGTFKERRAALNQAIEDQIIGQRITGLTLARTKSDFSFQAANGELVPAKQVELRLTFDNNQVYILRLEAVIKDMGEALAVSRDESDS